MRKSLGLLLIVLFLCSVAVLVVVTVKTPPHPIPVMPAVSPTELTEEERSAQFKERMKRRQATMNMIVSEVAKVMPQTASQPALDDPKGLATYNRDLAAVDKIYTSYLNSPYPEIRAAAVMCLQHHLPELPELLKHVWTATGDSDSEVSNCAGFLLLYAPLKAADAPRVIALLDNNNDGTRGYALRVMGDWGYSKYYAEDMDRSQLLPAVPRLFELLDDENSSMRHKATIVLRQLGPMIPDELDRTLELLTDGDLVQEKLATSILRGMGSDAIIALPLLVERMEADPNIREDGFNFQYWVAQAILDIEPELTEMVALKMAQNIGQLGDKGSSETRLLSGLGADASAVVPLLKSYQVGEVNDVYLNASKALSYIAPNDPEVIHELRKMMVSTEEFEKYWIIDGLGRATTNFELARHGLELVLGSDDELHRKRAQEILDEHK